MKHETKTHVHSCGICSCLKTKQFKREYSDGAFLPPHQIVRDPGSDSQEKVRAWNFQETQDRSCH